jgi:hypothetical protein
MEAPRPDGKLSDDYIFPPFSLLDARSGAWRDRKAEWISRYALGADTEATREAAKAYQIHDWAADRGTKLTGSGTSLFDPVLCELMYRWFCPPGGWVFDPFGGEATKGIVAAALGCKYVGIELRADQVRANREHAYRVGLENCQWVVGDAALCDDIATQRPFDLAFTSPPYFDLETYGGGDADGSEMGSYSGFVSWLVAILCRTVNRLALNRFLVVKLGDLRDDAGALRGLVHDVVIGLRHDYPGLHYYNELVLATPIGTLAVRTSAGFPVARKIGRGHQTVLVFWKGNPRSVKEVTRDWR